MAGRIISVINQKGGIGKSTLAGTLTTGLKIKGYKTLLVELDPQSNTAFCFRATPPEQDKDILTYMLKGKPLRELIQHTTQGDIIPSVPTLAGADVTLYKKYKDSSEQMKLLKKALEPLQREYDYIFIDNAPALNRISYNSLVACTDVLIPAKPEIYSLQAIGQLRNTIKSVQSNLNPDLKITGIVITMYRGATNLHKDVVKSLKDFAGALETQILRTPIKTSIDIPTAQDNRIDIFSYRKNGKKSNIVGDYIKLMDELQEIWSKGDN